MITATPATRRFFRPTWVEVDLFRICANLSSLRSRLDHRTKLMFVVKANAYGHGALACAQAAEPLIDWLGVSSVEEGVALREGGVKRPVLVLGSLYPFESFLAAAEHGLTPTVASLEAAHRLAEAARVIGRRLGCHLKIETGMGRIGMSAEAAIGAAEFIAGRKDIVVEGVYTHFACAEESAAFTKAQLERFRKALSALERAGAPLGLRHAANSVAALRLPASHFDLVRPGLAAYGLSPGFEPALSLKSRVVFVKHVPKGTAISYGAAFKCRRPSRIATVPIGYADGLPRALSGKGFALVRGRRCRIAGRMTMDMVMLDATDLPDARVGDEAVFIGRQGEEEISAGELARTLRTIPYEIVCAVSARVPRVYRT